MSAAKIGTRVDAIWSAAKALGWESSARVCMCETLQHQRVQTMRVHATVNTHHADVVEAEGVVVGGRLGGVALQVENVDNGNAQDSDKQGANGTQEEELPARAQGERFMYRESVGLAPQQRTGSRVQWMLQASAIGWWHDNVVVAQGESEGPPANRGRCSKLTR